MDQDYHAVMSQYPSDCRARNAHYLATAGGFSGAQFWRITAPRGELCLRRWPTEHPNRRRLLQIHHVLRHVYQQGFLLVPVPVHTLAGLTFVEQEGALYELTPWLPGVADFDERPTEKRLRAAMTAAARFHIAASSVAGFERKSGYSPAIVERRSQVTELRGGGIRRIAAAVSPGINAPLEPLAWEVLSLVPPLLAKIDDELRESETTPLALQPSIRDLRSEHFLFEGEQVSGIVDFGSMRVETPVGDIARALGSLVGDDVARRRIGLQAYETERPLTAGERAILPAFDHSEVVFSAVNWLDWIYCQRRQFDDPQAVLSRIRQLVARLRHLASQDTFS